MTSTYNSYGLKKKKSETISSWQVEQFEKINKIGKETLYNPSSHEQLRLTSEMGNY